MTTNIQIYQYTYWQRGKNFNIKLRIEEFKEFKDFDKIFPMYRWDKWMDLISTSDILTYYNDINEIRILISAHGKLCKKVDNNKISDK